MNIKRRIGKRIIAAAEGSGKWAHREMEIRRKYRKRAFHWKPVESPKRRRLPRWVKMAKLYREYVVWPRLDAEAEATRDRDLAAFETYGDYPSDDY